MGNIAIGPQIDDTELDEALEQLQQKELEDKMLETGTVPVDSIQRLPNVANGESESNLGLAGWSDGFDAKLTVSVVKGKAPAVAEDDEEAELKRLQAEMAM